MPAQTTVIRLLDGREWTFTALPFSRATVEKLSAFEAENDIAVIFDLIEQSLSGVHGAEAARECCDSGAIPWPTTPAWQEVLAAMVGGAAGFRGPAQA